MTTTEEFFAKATAIMDRYRTNAKAAFESFNAELEPFSETLQASELPDEIKTAVARHMMTQMDRLVKDLEKL